MRFHAKQWLLFLFAFFFIFILLNINTKRAQTLVLNTFDEASWNVSIPLSQKGALNVFVLPFSHVDPGWLKTLDEYSLETNKILSNMHEFMSKHEKMRFMWAEIVFFERWWSQQNSSVQRDVKRMLDEGRLEIATGSWVMTDEANVYFASTIDNMLEGFDFLANLTDPRTMWSNDPFGYTPSVAFLFQQAGLTSAVINRIPHPIKQQLNQLKAVPFRWSQYHRDDAHLLTHVLPYTHYDILNSCGSNPDVCCLFDFRRTRQWFCSSEKAEPIDERNVENRARKLLESLEKMADEIYETRNVLMMHGDDFRYDEIQEWHEQHDNLLKIFDHLNTHYSDRISIQFGTFSDYFRSVARSNREPPILQHDFFPYQCAVGDMWTGYYTTRPFNKHQERGLHALIHTNDQFIAGAAVDEAILKRQQTARRNLALFQHHDAITGTSRIHVMNDYSRRLADSSLDVKRMLRELNRSHSVDEVLRTAGTFVLYNPLGFNVSRVVRLPCSKPFQLDGVESQIEPGFAHSNGSMFLVFRAEIAALSGREYTLLDVAATQVSVRQVEAGEKVPIGDVTMVDGLIEKTTIGGVEWSTKQSFYSYRSDGGAYVMKIRGDKQEHIQQRQIYHTQGPVRDCVHLISVTIYQRVCGQPGHPIDIVIRSQMPANAGSLEVLTAIRTNLPGTRFYTDAIGLQHLRRQPNRFYPMATSAIVESAHGHRLTVHTDTPHGVRFNDARLEINIDRQAFQDDYKGLGSGDDALPIESQPFEMRFQLLLESVAPPQDEHTARLSVRALHSLQQLLYPPLSLDSLSGIAPIGVELPCDVQLVALRPISNKRTMLVLFRHPVLSDHCQHTDINEAVAKLLDRLKPTRVYQSDLSARPQSIIHRSSFKLKPFHFLCLILHQQ